MSAYGTKSKSSKRVATFRHPRLFTDESVREFYDDLQVGEDGEPTNLRQYEGTDRDAYVSFRRVRIGGDEPKIRLLMHYQDLVDWKLVQRLQQDPTQDQSEVDEILEGAKRTDYAYAKTEHFTVEVKGEYFRLPDDITNRDVYGDVDPTTSIDPLPQGLDGDAPHELAGQIPPSSHEWFELWDVVLLNDYLAYVDAVHGGRSPQQEATFPAPVIPADDAGPTPLRPRADRKKSTRSK